MNTSLFRLSARGPGRYLRTWLAAAPEPPLPAPVVAPNPYKILVVDDDAVILKTLSLKLTAHGYTVVTATDASSAIGAVRDERPDLVVLDLDFPPDIANGGRVTWDGFQIMSWLRGLQESQGIPFIILTGSEADSDEQRARTNRAVGFFRKPARPDELLRTIAEVLASRSPAPNQQAA